jgi:hypothetical protein
MALGQVAQLRADDDNDDDNIAAWMAQRWRGVSGLGAQAEATGRNLSAQATWAGQNLAAPNPSDILALGARFLNGGGGQVGPTSSGSAPSSTTPNPAGAVNPPAAPSSGQFMPTPDAPTLADLRRQQAQFGQVRNNLDDHNSWMAWATLLPAAGILGLEAAPALGIGGAEAAAPYSATSFPDLEAWQAQVEAQLGRPLSGPEKTALRPKLGGNLDGPWAAGCRRRPKSWGRSCRSIKWSSPTSFVLVRRSHRILARKEEQRDNFGR